MATSTGKKIEWLVILPDQQGVIERRMEVRPYVVSGLLSTIFLTPSSYPHFRKLYLLPNWYGIRGIEAH